MAVAPAAVGARAPASAPLGGAVGGDAGAAEIEGDDTSFEKDAAWAGPGKPLGKCAGATGTGDGGTVPGAPRTNAIAPASEAGIARKSASVSGPVGEAEGADGV